ncbi:unnamed protein product [Ectocarpus sp. 12 AP-2014]
MDVHAAALNGDVEDVRRFIAGSGDPNILNDAGITPLHSAAVQGQSEVIRVLVAAGADTDLKVCRDGGNGGATHDASPLLLAVVGGHLEAARVLLEGGAEVGAKNSKGLTPLHVSCLKPHPEMVTLLLLWGADTNARDRKKRTPEQVLGKSSPRRLGKYPVQEDAVRAILAQAAAAKQLALAGNAAGSHRGLHEGGGNRDSGVAANMDAAIATVPAADAGDRITPAAPTATAASSSLPPPPPPKHLSSDAAGVTTTGEEGNETKNLTSPLQSPPPPAPSLRELSAPPTLPPPPPPQPLATAAAMGTDAASVESDAGGAQGPAELEQPASSAIVHSHNQAPAGATAASAHDAASVVTAPATGGGKGGAAGAPAATSAAVEFASRAVLEGEYELEKALPCSSGSSEIWFASKVFTGEQVVVKKVLEGEHVTFERERAVLLFLQRQGVQGGCQHSIPFAGIIPRLQCLVLGRGGRTLRQIGQKFYRRYSGNPAGYTDRIRPYARQVVEVCQWLHRLGIVWGDVKPENFVEGQDDDLKAIDFDSACTLSGGMASLDKDVAERVQSRFGADHVLTPRYCAPERARASVSGESCLATKATDIWSVGMVLFWLLTGQDYFENGLTDEEVVMTLCSSGFTVSLAGVDPKQEQARNLLGTMLSHIPQERGSMDSVLGRAFFAGGASVTAARMQADMAASLGGVSSRLEAAIREEGGATRRVPTPTDAPVPHPVSLLDESMKRLESRADEILSKLGRMDRMLDHVVDGNADCPRLFVLTPVEGSQEIWKPDTWFSDCNLLTFLCAHDLAPIGKGIKVPCPRSNLEKWAPAIQASAFVLKLGSKAACMTTGISPAAVDGMSAALGINFLAGRKVSAALRSAAGKALGDVKGSKSEDAKHTGAGNQTLRTEKRSGTPDEEEGRILTGEAYEALVSFLDENDPSWRATMAADMTKAIRGDGKASVSWTCHDHASAWSRSGSVSTVTEEARSDCGTTGLAISSSSPRDASGPNNTDIQGLMIDKASVAMARAKDAQEGDPSLLDTGSRSEAGSDMPIGRRNNRKHGKSLGMFAKIKGRLGRHAG